MKNKKLLVCIFACIYVLSIVPLLYLGRYIHPLWDDFGSSFYSHMVIDSKRYYLLFVEVFIYVIGSWINWQGTYSAELLFNLQPGIWPIPMYWITPFIIIGSIAFAYLLFFRNLSKYVFRSGTEYGILIALVTLTVQFQFVPFLHQGFYWYNGAIYYGFFYALLVIELSMVIRLLFSDSKSSKWLPVMAVFISGGNYSTALIHCLILIIFSVVLTLKKNDKKKQLWPVTIAAVIGLVISMVAPGNSVRAAETTSMPALRAIFASILNAKRYVFHWVRIPQLVLIIIIAPIIYLMVRDIKLSFAKMLIIQLILFGLFAAEATPAYYAMSFPGETRQVDMYYYSFYLIMVLSFICFMTWITSAVKISIVDAHKKQVMIIYIVVLISLIACGAYVTDVSELNSYKVASEIRSGRAAAYDAEYREKINEIITSGDICVIDDIENYSDILPALRITEDPDFWINDHLGTYYGKKEIRLRKDQ